MTKLIPGLILLYCLSGCKKEHGEWITGTVTDQQGCLQHSRVVRIDQPDNNRHPFLCDQSLAVLSSSPVNCGNAVVIMDMPHSLAQAGTKIRFRRWKHEGLSCYSSIMAPNQIAALDLRPY